MLDQLLFGPLGLFPAEQNRFLELLIRSIPDEQFRNEIKQVPLALEHKRVVRSVIEGFQHAPPPQGCLSREVRRDRVKAGQQPAQPATGLTLGTQEPGGRAQPREGSSRQRRARASSRKRTSWAPLLLVGGTLGALGIMMIYVVGYRRKAHIQGLRNRVYVPAPPAGPPEERETDKNTPLKKPLSGRLKECSDPVDPPGKEIVKPCRGSSPQGAPLPSGP